MATDYLTFTDNLFSGDHAKSKSSFDSESPKAFSEHDMSTSILMNNDGTPKFMPGNSFEEQLFKDGSGDIFGAGFMDSRPGGLSANSSFDEAPLVSGGSRSFCDNDDEGNTDDEVVAGIPAGAGGMRSDDDMEHVGSISSSSSRSRGESHQSMRIPLPIDRVRPANVADKNVSAFLLMLLVHARACRIPDAEHCSFFKCGYARKLNQHVSRCRKRNCTSFSSRAPRTCVRAGKLLRHFASCRDKRHCRAGICNRMILLQKKAQKRYGATQTTITLKRSAPDTAGPDKKKQRRR